MTVCHVEAWTSRLISHITIPDSCTCDDEYISYQNTHAYPFPSVLSVTQTEGYVFAYTLSTTLIHRALEPPLGNNISSFRDHELREPLLVFNMPVASDAANVTSPSHEGFT